MDSLSRRDLLWILACLVIGVGVCHVLIHGSDNRTDRTTPRSGAGPATSEDSPAPLPGDNEIPPPLRQAELAGESGASMWTVFGMVSETSGIRVGGCRLRFISDSRRSNYEAVTDRDGTYQMLVPSGVRVSRVIVSAGSGSMEIRSGLPTEAVGTACRWDVVIPDPVVVTGRVVSFASHVPVAGVLLGLRSQRHGSRARDTELALSHHDGRFELMTYERGLAQIEVFPSKAGLALVRDELRHRLRAAVLAPGPADVRTTDGEPLFVCKDKEYWADYLFGLGLYQADTAKGDVDVGTVFVSEAVTLDVSVVDANGQPVPEASCWIRYPVLDCPVLISGPLVRRSSLPFPPGGYSVFVGCLPPHAVAGDPIVGVGFEDGSGSSLVVTVRRAEQGMSSLDGIRVRVVGVDYGEITGAEVRCGTNAGFSDRRGMAILPSSLLDRESVGPIEITAWKPGYRMASGVYEQSALMDGIDIMLVSESDTEITVLDSEGHPVEVISVVQIGFVESAVDGVRRIVRGRVVRSIGRDGVHHLAPLHGPGHAYQLHAGDLGYCLVDRLENGTVTLEPLVQLRGQLAGTVPASIVTVTVRGVADRIRRPEANPLREFLDACRVGPSQQFSLSCPLVGIMSLYDQGGSLLLSARYKVEDGRVALDSGSVPGLSLSVDQGIGRGYER